MIQLFERKFIELTPDLAKHYLKFNDYPAQREVREAWINHLAECREKGTFRFGEVAFAVHKDPTLRDCMMNGQHVCYMVIKTGRDVTCVLERYYVDNKQDKAKLFMMFEYMVRTVSDFVKSQQIALDKEHWPRWLAYLVVSTAAIEYANNKTFTSPTTGKKNSKWLTKDKRASLLEGYLTEGAFLYELLVSKESKSRSPAIKHMTKAAVVYVIFNTWRKDPTEAGTFWRNVRDGEHLIKTDPEKILREFLMQAQTRVTAYSARRATNHEFVYKCIVAWNNFRAGRKITHLKYYPTKQPPRIK